jgi:hypothetical protein
MGCRSGSCARRNKVHEPPDETARVADLKVCVLPRFEKREALTLESQDNIDGRNSRN